MNAATRSTCTSPPTEKVIVPCLYCGKPLEHAAGSLVAQGILNSFCPDDDCEDLFALAL